MDKESLGRSYVEFLRQEGYSPQVDEDGDVRFKYEGKTYLVIVDADDPQFFRLILPNFWGVGDGGRARVLEMAVAASTKVKVAKIIVVRDNVWATLELFLPQAEDFRAVFPRSLSALNTGVRTFVKLMREDDPEVPSEV